MGFIARILGRCRTKPPADAGCWSSDGRRITVDLGRAAELNAPGGAIRLEGGTAPVRVLVFRDHDGEPRALANRCSHAGRRLDPVNGGAAVECCSVGRSRFGSDGQRLGGMAKAEIKAYPTSRDGDILTIFLE